jgi:predicted nucleic acid-binding protein
MLSAVAERYRFPILTTDEDFLKFGRVLPLHLHARDK